MNYKILVHIWSVVRVQHLRSHRAYCIF